MNTEQTSKRRNFLKTTLALGATAFINPLRTVASVSEKADEFVIAVGPYLQTNFGNEMTILWLTNKVGAGWVEFGEDASKLDKKAYGKSALGLKAANSKLNCVTLKGLSPGKTYYYRIYSNEIIDFQPYKITYGVTVNSETESFINTDISKKEVSFLMLNDIHDRPKSIPLLLDLDKGNRNDFIFFVFRKFGDNVGRIIRFKFVKLFSDLFWRKPAQDIFTQVIF